MNNVKQHSLKLTRSFITVGIIFIVSFVLCLLVYNFVSNASSYTLAIQVAMAVVAINPVIKLFVRFGVFDVFVIEERSNAIFG